MQVCRGCQRHVRFDEAVCPFCAARLPRVVSGGPLPAGLVLGLCTAACGPAVDDGGSGGGGSGEASSSDSVTATSTGTGTTTNTDVTSVGPTVGTVTTDATTDGQKFDVGGGSSTGDAPLQCDFWDGACGAESKCVPYVSSCPGFYGAFCTGGDWDRTACATVDEDPAGVGQPCSPDLYLAEDECGVAAICVLMGFEIDGVCTPYCSGTQSAPTCDDPDTACAAIGGVDLPVCLAVCDLDADDCPDGTTCTETDWGDSVCSPNWG